MKKMGARPIWLNKSAADLEEQVDDRGHKVSVCHEENGAAVAAALKCLLIYVSVIKLKYESLKFHFSGGVGLCP